MTCQEVVETITDYLEGTMGGDERRRFDAHLAECPHCVHYLEQMRHTLDAVGRLREESLSPDFRDSVVELFRGWRQPRV